MFTVLITGASGFIGQALATQMAKSHNIVCLSRKDPGLGLAWIQGDFSAPEDLGLLDDLDIDVVVHLAAVTGGCAERDGITVNVEGTRALVQHLASSGCRKFRYRELDRSRRISEFSFSACRDTDSGQTPLPGPGWLRALQIPDGRGYGLLLASE